MKQDYAACGKPAEWSLHVGRIKEKYPRRRSLQADLEKF
jgi:hypothetical protein